MKFVIYRITGVKTRVFAAPNRFGALEMCHRLNRDIPEQRYTVIQEEK